MPLGTEHSFDKPGSHLLWRGLVGCCAEPNFNYLLGGGAYSGSDTPALLNKARVVIQVA